MRKNLPVSKQATILPENELICSRTDLRSDLKAGCPWGGI